MNITDIEGANSRRFYREPIKYDVMRKYDDVKGVHPKTRVPRQDGYNYLNYKDVVGPTRM